MERCFLITVREVSRIRFCCVRGAQRDPEIPKIDVRSFANSICHTRGRRCEISDAKRRLVQPGKLEPSLVVDKAHIIQTRGDLTADHKRDRKGACGPKFYGDGIKDGVDITA